MQIDFFFKNFTPVEKESFEDYFETKISQLEKLIQRYISRQARSRADGFRDVISLRVKAEKFNTKSAYKVTLDLKFPKKSFLVSEDDHTIMEAIDLAKDKLIRQLKRFR